MTDSDSERQLQEAPVAVPATTAPLVPLGSMAVEMDPEEGDGAGWAHEEAFVRGRKVVLRWTEAPRVTPTTTTAAPTTTTATPTTMTATPTTTTATPTTTTATPTPTPETTTQDSAASPPPPPVDFRALEDFYAKLITTANRVNNHLYNVTGEVKLRADSTVNAEGLGTGTLEWEVPSWLPSGMYVFEIGSPSRKAMCAMYFTLSEASGDVDETNVGVWCVCGVMDSKTHYTGHWIECSECGSWHHVACYSRKTDAAAASTPEASMQEDDEDDTQLDTSPSVQGSASAAAGEEDRGEDFDSPRKPAASQQHLSLSPRTPQTPSPARKRQRNAPTSSSAGAAAAPPPPVQPRFHPSTRGALAAAIAAVEAASGAGSGDKLTLGRRARAAAAAHRYRKSKRERREQTERVAAATMHRGSFVPQEVSLDPNQVFLCWMCQTIEGFHPEKGHYNVGASASAAADTTTSSAFLTPLPSATTTSTTTKDPQHVQGEDDEAARHARKTLVERLGLMMSMLTTSVGGYYRRSSSYVDGPDMSPMLCCTPLHVVKFLRRVLAKHVRGWPTARAVDLGAGTGALTAALNGLLTDVTCVEIDQRRCEVGKRDFPRQEWLNMDVMDPGFYASRLGTLDVVVCNPDFEVAAQFIQASLALIRNPYFAHPSSSTGVVEAGSREHGTMFFILPSDFFEASAIRSRIFKLLNFHIEVEYRLGHLCYYKNSPNAQKITCDSLYVLKPGRGPNKYEHKAVSARLGGML